jgi:hypothetical protein
MKSLCSRLLQLSQPLPGGAEKVSPGTESGVHRIFETPDTVPELTLLPQDSIVSAAYFCAQLLSPGHSFAQDYL